MEVKLAKNTPLILIFFNSDTWIENAAMSEFVWEGSAKDSRITKLGRRLVRASVEFCNRRGEYFVTRHERAKYDRMIGTWADVGDFGTTAIVIQGPIIGEDNFTVETLKIYKRHFPGCLLILSTWADTPRAELDPIEALGVKLVLSDKPRDPGFFNINMQITSAGNGVKCANAEGATWIMKTRTDQRVYNPNVLGFLVAIAKTFPPAKTANQRSRIIGIGQGTLKFAPYHVTDQTLFGHADDMLKYWTPPLCESNLKFSEVQEKTHALYVNSTIRDLCSTNSPEAYLGSQFLLRVGRKELKWTLEDSWSAFKDHFCFVDYSATDFFWHKAQKATLTEFTTRYDIVTNRQEMNFSEWLLLYSGQTPCELARDYEEAAEMRFNSIINRP